MTGPAAMAASVLSQELQSWSVCMVSCCGAASVGSGALSPYGRSGCSKEEKGAQLGGNLEHGTWLQCWIGGLQNEVVPRDDWSRWFVASSVTSAWSAA